MASLKITLMGTPEIQHQNTPLNLERRKAVALIAYLAVVQKPVGRDYLATMLWEDYNDERARASLRRTLAVINKTPIGDWLTSDRNTVSMILNDDLYIDTMIFEELLSENCSAESITQAFNLYQNGFMSGFSLRDSITFDNWQSLQAQTFQQMLNTRIDACTQRLIEEKQYEDAVVLIQQWLKLDPIQETAHERLLNIYGITDQRTNTLRHYEAYKDLLWNELGVEPVEHVRQLYESIRDGSFNQRMPAHRQQAVKGNLPPVPALVIGREEAMHEIKRRIGLNNTGTSSQTAIIQGWPGIGKTTLVSLLAHENDVHQKFRDGVLWTSLGESPNILAELIIWAQALGVNSRSAIQSIEEAQTRISAQLRNKQMLLIIDDAWQTAHALPFKVGGASCVTIFTTRMNDVAKALSSHSSDIYKIPVLTEDAGLNLMRELAPEVIAENIEEACELIADLEGLPLALQVAARLLHSERSMGWDIHNLITELKEGAALLTATAPADRIDLVNETTPTIAVLLQRSTDLLDADSQERFALLGVFAPKPATFEQEAIKAVWEVEDPKPTIRKLVDRGLLDPIGGGKFQMHALLVMHAKSMFAL